MPTITAGQYGSGKAGRTLPGRNDPMHQLATLLGIMAGDKYRQADIGEYTSDELSMDAGKSEAPKITEFGAPTDVTPRGGGGVLDAAAKYLGIDYVYGGTDPANGLDCSGFVQRAFADVGVMLPRVTYDQVNVGSAVGSFNELRAGDLIFFWGDKGNRRNGHVGIYVGNGMMIDAPRTGLKVGYRKVNQSRITAMRRVT